MQRGPARNSARQRRAGQPRSFRAFELSPSPHPTGRPIAPARSWRASAARHPIPSHPIAALAAHLTTRSPPARLHRRWRLHFVCSCACAHAAQPHHRLHHHHHRRCLHCALLADEHGDAPQCIAPTTRASGAASMTSAQRSNPPTSPRSLQSTSSHSTTSARALGPSRTA